MAAMIARIAYTTPPAMAPVLVNRLRFRLRRFEAGADAKAAHLLPAAKIRVFLGIVRAGTRLHENDLGSTLVATKSFSSGMRHR
jgi:hypothetical protein